MALQANNPIANITPAEAARYRPFSPFWSTLSAWGLYFIIFYTFSFAIEQKNPLAPPEWTQNLAKALSDYQYLSQIIGSLTSPIFNLIEPKILKHVAIPLIIAHLLANYTAGGLFRSLYGYSSSREASKFLQRLKKETMPWRPYRSRKFYMIVGGILIGAFSYFGLLGVFSLVSEYLLFHVNLPGVYYSILIMAFLGLWLVLTVIAMMVVKERYGNFEEHFNQAGWMYLIPYFLIAVIMLVFPLIFIVIISERMAAGIISSNMVLTGLFICFVIISIAAVVVFLLTPNQPEIVEITPDDFESQRNTHTRLHPPGPIRVWMLDGHHVATTEYNGRFHRVLKPGRYNLQPFEYIYSVLDLRQQVAEDFSDCVTRDGIQVRFNIGLTIRIATNRNLLDHDPHSSTVSLSSSLTTRPTERMLFPFDEHAVRAAAYLRTTLDSKGIRVNNWATLPLLLAKARLRILVLEMSYNDLFRDREGDMSTHQWLTDQIQNETQAILNRIGTGVHVIELRLGPVEAVHPEVVDGQVETWRAEWEKQNRFRKIEIQREIIAAKATARRQAEQIFIETIVKEIEATTQKYDEEISKKIIALQVVDTLDRMIRFSPGIRTPAAMRLLNEIGSVRELISQNGTGAGKGNADNPTNSA